MFDRTARRARVVIVGLLQAHLSSAAVEPPRSAPYDLIIAPQQAVAGDRVQLTVRRRRLPSHEQRIRFDLYIVLAKQAEAIYLTQRSGWSSTPHPYLRNRSLVNFSKLDLSRTIERLTPYGSYTVAVVFSKPKLSPLNADNWVYPPLIVEFRVRPPSWPWFPLTALALLWLTCAWLVIRA
jgi:hypothetical protein